MANELVLEAGTLPADKQCFTTKQELFEEFTEYMAVVFGVDLALFNFGSATPTAENRDKPWIRTNPDGTYKGTYVYVNGSWGTDATWNKGDVIWTRAAVSTIVTPWSYADGNSGVQINGVDIPDLRNGVCVGAGDMYSLGQTGGETTHTLTEAEMPAHTHGTVPLYSAVPNNRSGGNSIYDIDVDGNTASTGGSLPHENMPPFVALNPKIYVGFE